MTGALSGVRVVEMAGIGPVPLATMLLADMGAEVIRIDRMMSAAVLSGSADPSLNIVNRGRQSLQVDIKQPAGRDLVLRLVRDCDVFVEGFRPGVTERLGLGPEACLEINPRLVYGRMTGWGQDGPLAQRAGHDINYIALSGALWATGRKDEVPTPPLNLLGDYGGGAMFLAFGVVCALLERASTGRGQVVDAAMIDGVSILAAMVTALRGMGRWKDERGANLLDTGYPDYEVYECSDGQFVAVGAIEPQFYAELVARTGFVPPEGDRSDPATFAARKKAWAELFRTRSRDDWAALVEGSDACLSPVLDWAEAADHPHLRARGTYVERDGMLQPAPAPRLSRTPGAIGRRPPAPGADTVALLADLGLDGDAIEQLRAAGVVRWPSDQRL
jgi:alpha-methylacyl-CoA racemase